MAAAEARLAEREKGGRETAAAATAPAPGLTPEADLDAEIGTAAAPDTETKGKTHAK